MEPATAPNTWPGNGATLKEALEDAREKAKGDGKPPGWYHVVSIHVRFDNPLSEYRVVIGGGP